MSRAVLAFCLCAALCACGSAPSATATRSDAGPAQETGSTAFMPLSSDGATASFIDSSPSNDAPTAKDPMKGFFDGPSGDALESDGSAIDSSAKGDSDNTAETDSGASSDAGDAFTATVDSSDPDAADSDPPPCGEPQTPCCAAHTCHAAFSCFNGLCY